MYYPGENERYPGKGVGGERGRIRGGIMGECVQKMWKLRTADAESRRVVAVSEVASHKG